MYLIEEYWFTHMGFENCSAQLPSHCKNRTNSTSYEDYSLSAVISELSHNQVLLIVT